MTTPLDQAEYIYTTTLWPHLPADRRDDPAFRQKMVEDIAYEIAQALPQWIPVGERSPDEGQYILPYALDAVDAGYYYKDDWFSQGVWQVNGNIVTHWIPLPEEPTL